jgi:hypothetical protein
MFLFFIFYQFSSTKSENRRAEQVLLVGGEWHQWEWGGSGERGKRLNKVHMWTNVCKCKNDTYSNYFRNQGRADKGDQWRW